MSKIGILLSVLMKRQGNKITWHRAEYLSLETTHDNLHPEAIIENML